MLGSKDQSFCIAHVGNVIKQRTQSRSSGRREACLGGVSHRSMTLSDWFRSLSELFVCNNVLYNQPFIQQDQQKRNSFSRLVLTLCHYFLPGLPPLLPPPTSLCSPQVFWHPGEVTWLCSGTCGACVAAAGTRWAPAGSLWMASVASPPAHAPPLEHTHTHIYRNCNQTHYGNVLMIKPLQQDLLYLAHPPHADTFSSYLSGSSPTSLKYPIRFCSHWQAAEYRRWLIMCCLFILAFDFPLCPSVPVQRP